jgi:hypothetical protein
MIITIPCDNRTIQLADYAMDKIRLTILIPDAHSETVLVNPKKLIQAIKAVTAK